MKVEDFQNEQEAREEMKRVDGGNEEGVRWKNKQVRKNRFASHLVFGRKALSNPPLEDVRVAKQERLEIAGGLEVSD